MVVLREYLYVDTVAVRGLLAQLDSGVTENEVQENSNQKTTGGGFKGLLDHSANWGTSTTTEKSFGDAVFPHLEEGLEESGMLEDVSDSLVENDYWTGDLVDSMPPGKIVRITAPGYLMDSRFMASMLTGFAVTHRGLAHIGAFDSSPAETPMPPRAKRQQSASKATPKNRPYKPLPAEEDSLEYGIPLGKMAFSKDDDNPIDGAFLRGIVQVIRGMFAPGLHLALTPNIEVGGAITVRLQENRQFLDSEPDVIFSRYGMGPQEWTVVGTVGHHAAETPDMSESNFMDNDSVRREKFAQYVAGLGAMLGNLGFTDLAQAPGFSMVPWAVYRTIGKPESGPSETEVSA